MAGTARAKEDGLGQAFPGGTIVVILGAYILASGIWVISFGGPWGNALTGVGMVGGGALNARGRALGDWVHAVVWVGTLVWALA